MQLRSRTSIKRRSKSFAFRSTPAFLWGIVLAVNNNPRTTCSRPLRRPPDTVQAASQWRSDTSPSTVGLSSRRRTPSSLRSCVAAARNSRLKFGRPREKRTLQNVEVLGLVRIVLAPRLVPLPTVTMNLPPQNLRYVRLIYFDFKGFL